MTDNTVEAAGIYYMLLSTFAKIQVINDETYAELCKLVCKRKLYPHEQTHFLEVISNTRELDQ